MAAKKQAKQAKPDPQSDQIDKPVLSVELEQAIEAPAVPVLLSLTASQLAHMGRDAKAGKRPMDLVIGAHEVYLKNVAQGAAAPAADVDFVKKHMAHLKTL